MGPSSTSPSSCRVANSLLLPHSPGGELASIPGNQCQVIVDPVEVRRSEDAVAVEDGRPLPLPIGAATRPDRIHIARALSPDLDLGHLCRLWAATADMTAGRLCIGPDRARGPRPLVAVGAVAAAAVDVDGMTAMVAGGVPAAGAMTATTVAAGVGVANGAEDNLAQRGSCGHEMGVRLRRKVDMV